MSLSHPVSRHGRTLSRATAVALLTALVATSGLVVPEPAHADRDRSAESSIVSMIDRERTDRSLPRLTTAGDVSDVAAVWSARMAERGELAHNPSYSDQICCWTRVSENVAVVSGIRHRGGLQATVRVAHQLFMNSSPHRANILDADVNEVGVGVYIDDDTLWVTQNFRHRPGSTPPSSSSGGGESTRDEGGGESTRDEGADTAGNDTTSNATAASRPAVDPRDVQRRLAALGWYDAEVDGVVGPMTREAVTAFHGAVGLETDGQIRAATLAALTEDDPPHRSGAGGWADRSAAFDALRQRALEIRNRKGQPAVETHPVFTVLDRVVAAQSSRPG